MKLNTEIKPTDSELEILQVLWDRGPSSVREVNTFLSRNKKVGYTTTLKIMQIMHDKGLVNRNTSSRSHIYSAACDIETTRAVLLKRFLKNTFGGSSAKLVMQALGSDVPSGSELKQIKELIDKLENRNE